MENDWLYTAKAYWGCTQLFSQGDNGQTNCLYIQVVHTFFFHCAFGKSLAQIGPHIVGEMYREHPEKPLKSRYYVDTLIEVWFYMNGPSRCPA